MSEKLGAKPKTSNKETEISAESQQVMIEELMKSLKKHFDGLCMCAGCLKTAHDRNNPSYPHWFGKTSTAAKFIKKALLENVRSKDPAMREMSIRAFSTLVGNDHGGSSDIIHMSKISVDELSAAIERLSAANKDVATFLDLFQLLLMCSWKTDSHTVHFTLKSKQVCYILGLTCVCKNRILLKFINPLYKFTVICCNKQRARALSKCTRICEVFGRNKSLLCLDYQGLFDRRTSLNERKISQRS